MKRLIISFGFLFLLLSNGHSQNYRDLYDEASKIKGFNFLLQSESFLQEQGYTYLIISNPFYELISPYDSMPFSRGQLYFLRYHYYPPTGEKDFDTIKSIAVSKHQLDSLFRLTKELYLIPDIIYEIDTSEFSLPFGINEGYAGFVVLDLCTIGNKYRVDIEDTELDSHKSSPFGRLFMYLNSILPYEER